jgi:twitching motility protein PilT
MAEFVLGAGQQQSARTVIRMIEQHLLRTEGIPRRIQAHADNVEITADRADFKGEFDTWFLRLRVTEKSAQRLTAVAQEYADVSSMSLQDGVATLTCPPKGVATGPRALEAVDKLCQCVSLPEIWRASGDNYRIDRVSSELLFQAMIQYKASDVHLSPGVCPVFRIDGDIHHSELLGPLSAVQISTLIHDTAPEEYWKEFERAKQTSFNYHQVGLGYSRVSAFIKSGAPHCTFRFLPETVPTFEELNIPRDTMVELAALHHGLLLVTGMTGSGKTTTVAAMTDYINAHNSMHILTIENPVEYVHINKQSVVSQRSLGADVGTFNEAVTGALRHDPDVVVIGEMRDADTIRAAINAAATGHLVISTLHSNTASEVINRIVSFFDPVERDLVRLQLRDCIRCVICQRLVPKIGGGRIPTIEIMINDIKPISDGILSGDTDLIRVGMQQSISHSFLFEQYLYKLFKQGKIDLEHAREYCTDRSTFDQLHMGTYSVPRLDSIKGRGDHEMFKT